MSIRNNITRVGNITSSEIVAILANGKEKDSLGKPALTYIEECNFERKLGRSIQTEVNTRSTSWGDLCEQRVFDLLGFEYILSSQSTVQHPTINYWSGSPDATKIDTVGDVKCPFTLKSFCQLVESKDIEELRENHKDGEKYYWQLVSNAVLTDKQYAELIVYMPYYSELEIIRELASQNDTPDQNKFAWVNWAADEDLPYLNDGGHYKNINVIRFEVPEADKNRLTDRVLKCGKLLIERV